MQSPGLQSRPRPHQLHLAGLPQPGRCFTRTLTRPRRRILRCTAGGRSEQNDFNVFTWGANLMRKLGGAKAEPGVEPPAPEYTRRPETRPENAAGDAEPSTSGRPAASSAVEQQDSGAIDSREALLQQRRRQYRHLSNADQVTEDWPPASVPTWSDWTEVFQETDQKEQEWSELEENLSEAVQAEDYVRAAELREQLSEISNNDDLDNLMTRYREAVQNEDFSEAARLRDYGGVGLLGWWWPQSSNTDNPSHLLRVVRAYNRYMFLAYKPSDIAHLHGLVPKEGVVGESPEELVYTPQPTKQDYDDAGHPVMELYYKSFPADPASEGQQGQQKNGEPDEEEVELRAQACAFAMETQDLSAASGSLGLGLTEDQLANISSDELEEIKEDDDEEVSISLTVVVDGEEDGQSLDSQTLEDISELTQSLASTDASVAGEATVIDEEDLAAGDFSFLVPKLQRVPALIHKFEGDRDRFMVQVLPTEAEEAAIAEAAKQEEAEREEAERRAEEQPAPADVEVVNLADVPDKQDILSQLLDIAKDKGVDVKPIAVKLRVKGALDNSKVDFKMLADEIVKGKQVSWESNTVAEILESVFERVEKGRTDSKEVEYGLKGSISYKRVSLDPQRTDPFTGIFVGIFGGHGPEVLQLRRVMGEDGKEYVEGMKLTGDAHVPAGSVAFKAAIGMKQRIPGYGYYPPDLNVVARYKGQGRVAKSGYRDARWVDGELIQFGSSIDFAKGAELGFLWNVGGDNRFLSLLQRISLDNPLLDDSSDSE